MKYEIAQIEDGVVTMRCSLKDFAKMLAIIAEVSEQPLSVEEQDDQPTLTPAQRNLIRGAAEWIAISSEALHGRIFDVLSETRRCYPNLRHQLKNATNLLQRETHAFTRTLRPHRRQRNHHPISTR